MFIQQVVNGIILGSIYSLIALGYTMVYGIIMLINFAHGEIYMFGAFAGMILVAFYNVPFSLAFLLSKAFAGLVGLTLEYLAYRPLRRSTRLAALISAIGASIFLQNAALLIMGARPYTFPNPIIPKVYQTSLLSISKLELIILAISFVLMLGLTFLFKNKNRQRMRCCTGQRYSQSYGDKCKPDHLHHLFHRIGLGSCCRGNGRNLFSNCNTYNGFNAGLKRLCSSGVRGIGSIPGAMLGGLLLGVAEVMAAAYISSQYRDAAAFAILIFVLFFKPAGLLGSFTQEKV